MLERFSTDLDVTEVPLRLCPSYSKYKIVYEPRRMVHSFNGYAGQHVDDTHESLLSGMSTTQANMSLQPDMSTGQPILLEVCASSIHSVLNANKAGAHRIELCSNLEQGGITPSYGTIQRALFCSQIPVNVLIRPRAGNFVYDHDEINIMVEDIEMCKKLGCHGVVIGVLTDANLIDIPTTRELVARAHPLQVTFHRAFDDCTDKVGALEDIIATGCTRILTSGGCATAEAGIDMLRRLVSMAAGRIHIMPGAGVDPANVTKIVESTGVTEVHASAKVVSTRHLGHARSQFETNIWETDPYTVMSLLKELGSVGRKG